jgi:hypothetical protein
MYTEIKKKVTDCVFAYACIGYLITVQLLRLPLQMLAFQQHPYD